MYHPRARCCSNDIEDRQEMTKDSRAPFNVFNVIYRGGLGIISIDGNDFPVQLAIINHGKHSQRLHLQMHCLLFTLELLNTQLQADILRKSLQIKSEHAVRHGYCKTEVLVHL